MRRNLLFSVSYAAQGGGWHARSRATVAPARRTGRAGDAPWRLTDLISVEALQSIQDTFARAFGIPTVIIDTDAVNATAISHRLSFCEDLTRGSRAGQRCADCDACGMRDAAAGREPAIFECWNGLSDCAIPIAPKGQVLGYFLCGQVLTAPPDTTRYAATADEIGVDPRSTSRRSARSGSCRSSSTRPPCRACTYSPR